MAVEKTITVDGHFSPQKLTREDFVARWKNHAYELNNLASSFGDGDWYEQTCSIITAVEEKAGDEWDRLWLTALSKGA